MTSSLRSTALLAVLVLATGCRTQRFPGPMESLVRPLPIGEVPPGPYGPQEIIVYRLSDPVLVRRAGETTGFPLPVYAKRERLRSGASVQCAAGGRCELIWPQDASSVLLFDEGWVDLGEPSRDEPLVTFRRVTRARLVLTPDNEVVLMGGAVLRGDPEEKSGPFLLERARTDVLAVTNQSKRACTIAFRDAEILLSPGELLRLPLLGAGGAPFLRDPAEAVLEIAGREVRAVGALTIEGDTLTAGAGGASVQDGGLLIRLAEGEGVQLEVFAAPSGGPPPEPEPEPEPVAPPVLPGDVEPLEPLEPTPPAEEEADPLEPIDADGEDGADEPPVPTPEEDGADEPPVPAPEEDGADEPPLPTPEGEDGADEGEPDDGPEDGAALAPADAGESGEPQDFRPVASMLRAPPPTAPDPTFFAPPPSIPCPDRAR